VWHDEHKMVMMYSHLGGRSRCDNTADLSSDSLHATCVPRCIRMDLGISFAGTRS
jgi:hypothetical protein